MIIIMIIMLPYGSLLYSHYNVSSSSLIHIIATSCYIHVFISFALSMHYIIDSLRYW